MRIQSTVLALCLCATPVHSDSLLHFLVPTPISIALSVGKWMLQNKQDVYYIQVQATGQNEHQARQTAFELAIDRAVGSLVVTESQVRNNKLKSDNSFNYSSAYIKKFQQIDHKQTEQGVTLTLDVWVANSKISDRILVESESESTIAGNQIQNSLTSMEQEQKVGDRLLQSYLNDFPNRSFDITVDKSQVKVTDRQPVLILNYTVKWNKGYVQGLHELVSQTGNKNTGIKTVSIQRNSRSTWDWYFDTERYTIFYNNMIGSLPMIKISVLDNTGNVLKYICEGTAELSYDSWNHIPKNRFVELGSDSININKNYKTKIKSTVALDSLPVEEIHSYSIQIIAKNNC
jgi:hypothetical protein